MSAWRSAALLLRAVDYGESDRVVTLFTRERGKVSAIARGARKSKRRFAGGLQPFVLLSASFLRGRGALALLDSIEASHIYSGLLADLDRMSAGWAMLELVDQFQGPEAPAPALWDQLEAGLRALEHCEQPRDPWMRFAGSLLRLDGLAPELDACQACRRPWPFAGARLGLHEGGLWCSACAAGRGVAVSPAAVEGLQLLLDGQAAGTEAQALLGRLLESHAGRPLRAAAFALSTERSRVAR